jgi:PAS domain S-box-containing protein
MNMSVNDNSSIQLLQNKLSLLMNDKTGYDYLSHCVEAFTKELGFSSCCIYQLIESDGAYSCNPLYVSSAEYYRLMVEVKPGEFLIDSIIENHVYIENGSSHDLIYTDELLVAHNAQSIIGFLLKNINNEPLGFVLLVKNEAISQSDEILCIMKHHINRISAELERVLLSKSLIKSETNLNYIVETSRDFIWEIDLNGYFVNASRSSLTIYGYHKNEMLGKHYSNFMSKESSIDFEDYLAKSVQGNGIYDIVTRHLNKQNKSIQVIYNAKPKYDYRGICIGYAGTTTDITESVRAQVAVKNNSELFSSILSRLPVVFFRIDEKGYLIDIRGQGLKRMGVNDMEWVGKPGYGLFIGMDEMIDSALSGDTVHFESKGSLEGEPWWFYTSMFFDSWAGFGAVGFAVDITDQKKTEEKLVHLLNDNRDLAQRLVEVQEEERRTLSRELHDELGQSITAVKSLATAITVKSGSGYSEVRSLGNSIIDLSGRLYDVVNSLMRRLRPDILDSLGFEATINSCIDNSQLEKTGVNCQLKITGEINDLNEVVQITVYRIIQECLTNISKYAMASNVHIDIKREMVDVMDDDFLGNRISNNDSEEFNSLRDFLIITVVDDGVGMNLNFDLQHSETEQKMGLQGIKERVTALGGELLIESKPEDGVRIEAVLDLTTVLHSNGLVSDVKKAGEVHKLIIH